MVIGGDPGAWKKHSICGTQLIGFLRHSVVFHKPFGGFREHSMTDLMDEGEGVPVHTPIHSPAHSQIHSPTLQRAANVPTAELLRALMATVADLTI